MSEEFAKLMKRNGITDATSALYHPSSNDLAERAVQTLKEAMEKMENEYGSLEGKVLTPHATTGETLAFLLMGRRPRSRFDLLHPNLFQKTIQKQQKTTTTTETRPLQDVQG